MSGAAAAAASPDSKEDGNQMVELETLFRRHLKTQMSRQEYKRGLLDMSELVIEHVRTEYEDGGTTKPASQVTSCSELSNRTSSPQTLLIHTEREVSTSYKVSMQRCITKEASVNLSITPPESILKLGAAAKRSVQLSGGRETSDVEKTKWSLDSTVVVQPGTKTRVQVRLKEEEFEGRFRVVSTISGAVAFKLRNRDGSLKVDVTPIRIRDVRTALRKEDGFVHKTGTEKAVEFTSSGKIYCRCGVKQEVELIEEKL